MPRQKNYQLDTVMAKAISYARLNGYRAANMQRLISVTKFNRRAFYLEFGNKQKFFERLVAFYITNTLDPLILQLNSSDDARVNLSAYFDAYRTLLDQGPCLLVRLLCEIGNESPTISTLANDYYDRLTQHFLAILEKSYRLPDQLHLVNNIALQLMFITQSVAVSRSLAHRQHEIQMLLEELLLPLETDTQ